MLIPGRVSRLVVFLLGVPGEWRNASHPRGSPNGQQMFWASLELNSCAHDGVLVKIWKSVVNR